VNTAAKYLAAPDFPSGMPADVADGLLERMSDRWGTDDHVLLQVPSKADDPRFRAWYAKKTRAIAGPAAAAAYFRSIYKERLNGLGGLTVFFGRNDSGKSRAVDDRVRRRRGEDFCQGRAVGDIDIGAHEPCRSMPPPGGGEDGATELPGCAEHRDLHCRWP